MNSLSTALQLLTQASLSSSSVKRHTLNATFAALELRLDKMQSTVTEHGQRMESLESNAELQDQRIRALEERCVALANTLPTSKAAAVETTLG